MKVLCEFTTVGIPCRHTSQCASRHHLFRPGQKKTPFGSSIKTGMIYHTVHYGICQENNSLPLCRKDAILQTYDVSLSEFRPSRTETDKEIRIVVPVINRVNGWQTAYAGFISFVKSTGVVEMANFQSSLDMRCLDIGYSTTKNDDCLGGYYGNGLKLAALVFCRGGVHIKLCSNSCHWNFALKGRGNRNLYCNITPASRDKVQRLRDKATRQRGAMSPRDLTANIWEDVSVIIKRESPLGKITQEEFERWLRTTIDINPPPGLIQTLAGDLFLDRAYSGSLYLKGLRLRRTNGIRMAYNLAHGVACQDRSEFVDHRLQLRLINQIWAGAIAQGNKVALTAYCTLLKEHSDCTDVKEAEFMIDEPTAKAIWRHLKDEASLLGRFYVPSDSSDLV